MIRIRPINTTLTLTALCVTCLHSAWAANLLENPSFEETSGLAATRWHVYLQPQPGGEARVDSPGQDGQYAALLNNPAPYLKEPVNNWSQNIIRALEGKILRLRGWIRTENATEAALWLQCWGQPNRLLAYASTSQYLPMSGTSDWKEVSTELKVPTGTDFVVVRCILLGTGKAWFDNLALEEPDLRPPLPPLPAKSPDPAAVNTATLEELRAMVLELRDINDRLVQHVWMLYQDTEDLRQRVSILEQAAQSAPPPPGTEAPPALPVPTAETPTPPPTQPEAPKNDEAARDAELQRVPPLVPYPYNGEGLR